MVLIGYLADMINKVLLVLMVMALGQPVIAQYNLDSLKLVLENQPEREQLAILDEIADNASSQYLPGYTNVFVYRDELSRKVVGIDSSRARMFQATGYLMKFASQEESNQFLANYENKLNELTAFTRGYVLFVKGEMNQMQRDLKGSKDAFFKSVEHFETSDSTHLRVYRDALRNLGVAHVALGEFGEAALVFKKAKEESQEHGDDLSLGYTYNEMAMLSSQIGMYAEAERYMKESKELATDNSITNEASYQVNLARNFVLQGKIDEAKQLYEKGLLQAPYPEGWEWVEMYFFNGLIECQHYLEDSEGLLSTFPEMQRKYDSLPDTRGLEFLIR
ncbi:MAG: tetratricopeptide repeat protein, partial [Bacteroidota bacterium]